jgi:hypothetical protein
MHSKYEYNFKVWLICQSHYAGSGLFDFPSLDFSNIADKNE